MTANVFLRSDATPAAKNALLRTIRQHASTPHDCAVCSEVGGTARATAAIRHPDHTTDPGAADVILPVCEGCAETYGALVVARLSKA